VSVRRACPRARCIALLFPAAVLAVHQLRYLLAFGSHAGQQLHARGDDYVATALVVVAGLLTVACAVGLARLVAVRRGRDRVHAAHLPLWLLWLGLTVALLVGFCALEALEIVLEPHHPAGVVGVFGDGGCWALPAAAAIGALAGAARPRRSHVTRDRRG